MCAVQAVGCLAWGMHAVSVGRYGCHVWSTGPLQGSEATVCAEACRERRVPGEAGHSLKL